MRLLVQVALLCVLVVAQKEVEKVQGILGPDVDPVSDEGLSIFDARGAHQTNEGMRKCYDVMRRTAGCPKATRKIGAIFQVGTTNAPLACKPEDRDGSNIIRMTYMLLRSMSKAKFVKNAYFTAPLNNKKPTNQHFLDVFLGQVVYNVLNAADQSAVATLPPAEKTKFDQLALPNQMWASLKFSMFSGNKERIAMGSTAFRAALRAIRSSTVVLWKTCRRVKFTFATLDVGMDVAKYAMEKRVTVGKIINKIVSTSLNLVAGAAPIGGEAAAAIVATVSELVDAAIDASADRKKRKYALQAILLELLSGFIPPIEDTPPLEAMVSANAAQSAEILSMLKAIQIKQGIVPRAPTPTAPKPEAPLPEAPKKSSPPPPQPQQPQQPPPVSSGRSGSSRSRSQKFRALYKRALRSPHPDYSMALVDDRMSLLEVGNPDTFKTVRYDENEACDTKVKALLQLVENLLEDEPLSDKGADDGVETPTYTEISTCGPNVAIMSEKENVLRSKATFKLLKFFVNVPDASDVEAESWLAKVTRIASTVIDKAAEGVNMAIGMTSDGGGGF